MIADIEPAPSDEEREAILTALSPPRAEPAEGGWAAAALAEGVEGIKPERP